MSKSGIASFFRWSFRGIVTVLLLGGWILSALALHLVVVPPEDGMPSMAEERGWLDWRLVVIPKDRLAVSGTYTDTRDWTADDLVENEAVVVRMTEAGKGDMLRHVGDNTLDRVTGGVLKAADEEPPAATPTADQ